MSGRAASVKRGMGEGTGCCGGKSQNTNVPFPVILQASIQPPSHHHHTKWAAPPHPAPPCPAGAASAGCAAAPRRGWRRRTAPPAGSAGSGCSPQSQTAAAAGTQRRQQWERGPQQQQRWQSHQLWNAAAAGWASAAPAKPQWAGPGHGDHTPVISAPPRPTCFMLLSSAASTTRGGSPTLTVSYGSTSLSSPLASQAK